MKPRPSFTCAWLRLALWLAFLAGLPMGQAWAQKLVSPVHGYLSIEPYEARLEFVVTYAEAALWLGLPAAEGNLDPARREVIERGAAAWLAGKCQVRLSETDQAADADTGPETFALQRTHFVRTDAVEGLAVEDRDAVPLAEALLGVVFAAPRDGPPVSVRVDWEVFPRGGAPAIVEIGSEDERITREVTPASPRLEWRPVKPIGEPGLLTLPPVRVPGVWRLPWLSLALAGGALVVAGIAWRRPAWRRGAGAGAFFLVAGALLVFGLGWGVRPWVPPWAGAPAPTPETADEIAFGLLRNIYHSFDYRSEERIYDTLRGSATEGLVGRLFLEVTRSLQVKGQGGARVRVLNLDLRKCEVTRYQGRPVAEFDAECEWIAIGNITHWGHTHKRLNRYRALLTIRGEDGRWRLAAIDLRDETRL